MSFRFAYGRPAQVAARSMVATSQPLATRAGLRMLERGGNAADAAIAAAAVLCIAEPMMTGIGGDCFALVCKDGVVEGLDAAGPAPATAAPLSPVEQTGPRSITVPGSVAGWAALSARYGKLGLDVCLADAIDAAERGVAAGFRTADQWDIWPAPAALSPAGTPPPGRVFTLPGLAATLRRIAEEGPDALYRGPVAEAIASVSWLEESDLAGYAPRWVEPLRVAYRGVEVVEMPPPTQGVAALIGLGLLDGFPEATLAEQIDCVRLGLEDAFTGVRDGADVGGLIEPGRLARRRADAAPASAQEPSGSTVYLCAVDDDRLAVSFIQSLYMGWGSGIVAPGTGIALQNRGACFTVNGAVEPGRRPYHTIIPGLLLQGGTPGEAGTARELLGPFGVMGGFIQAQAHVQLVSALVDRGLDPQAALDQPRFRLEGGKVNLEEGLWPRAAELEAAGHDVVLDDVTYPFGGGQCILATGEGTLTGGSDPRKDGYAAGF
jgi:gamma-glutamyltranspeptidase/glutathione hydrolase